MAVASINGIDLYYEVHGSGPAVVFLHGVGGNHAAWYQQAPFFARHYKVITVDQRGFGHSEDRNGLGRAGFVDDLRGLVDALSVDAISIVAQSMGGATGIGFAVRYPERTRSLVMADTLGGIELPAHLRSIVEANSAATRDLSQLERVVAKSFPIRDPARAELYLQIASFNRNNANRLNSIGPALPPNSIEAIGVAAKKVPMLFLVGEEDVLQLPAVIKETAGLIAGAAFTVVPDAGHSVYFERPDVFNYVVHDFLTSNLE
jgi:3-oxoadipate enol-lactonase